MKHSLSEEEIKSRKFGLSRFRKYPMPDAAHVRSAIKFFNYVTPVNEKELAKNILARMDEYGIDPNDINVGDNNRFKKYLKQDSLMHHGIKGMKWGQRKYQNSDGSLTILGKYRYGRNSRYINSLRKEASDHATRNERLAAAYRKSAADLRARGSQEARKIGYDKKTADKAAKILANQRDRYAKMGEDIAKNLRGYDTKLSQIDPSAQSYKDTKKLVKNILAESAKNMANTMNSYVDSDEYQTYRKAGGKDTMLVTSDRGNVHAR